MEWDNFMPFVLLSKYTSGEGVYNVKNVKLKETESWWKMSTRICNAFSFYM